ncbi:MAG: glycosyltransferase [Pseudomonadota bacterium]
MITAIIPFRNWSLERLERCVERLRQSAAISEIILVDFGSDEPLGVTPGCRIVHVEADIWCLSEANNIGIAAATNDVVLKIDADVELLIENEVLAQLASNIIKGAVSFYVLQPTDFDYIDGQPRRKRLRPSWGEGCGNLFSRADVVEIGGFDTRYFDYGGEDNDLCQRLRRYGKRVEVFQSDKVLHERHPPSEARIRGRFTDGHKEALLGDGSIFRPHPFRYSNYENTAAFGPSITVAIATTDRPNRAEHLAYCMTGLAKQSFQDFEVVICDNGASPENRLDQAVLAKAFPTLDIRVMTEDEPSIPKARNKITDNARGFYIAVHDDDDFSFPNRFEEQMECMASRDAAHGCHSAWIEFDEVTGQLKSYLGQRRDINELLRRPGKITLHSTGFYRRDVLARIRYDESLTLGTDHQLNMRMIMAGLDLPHTGKFHCLRRLHPVSVTSTGTAVQRDVADRTNDAYRFFLGEPYLAAVRAETEDRLWVTGFPTMREMLALLPSGFGAFHIDLEMEAALTLGFDPIFGTEQHAGSNRFAEMEFAPAFQGYGYKTRLVLRSRTPLDAGGIIEKLPAFRELRGVDIVAAGELHSQQSLCSLEALRVEKGQRRVISRRYANIADALAAIPTPVLTAGFGRIEFFAVNQPAQGVHVLLGTFDNAVDLEYALNLANSGRYGNFVPVANLGQVGGFHGA